MTQPAKAQEPSMEEILASIRRIIADDEAKPEAPQPVPAPRPQARQPEAQKQDLSRERPAPPTPRPMPVPKPQAVRAPAALAVANSQDDIDAMMAALEKEVPENVGRVALDDDVLELTEQMTVVEPRKSFQTVEPNNDIEFSDPAQAPVEAKEAISKDIQDRVRAKVMEETAEFGARPLMSHSTMASVDSAFNALAQTVLSNNARTLEDLVKEMLRPLLKSWLDDNLPNLVEKIVRSEIERVSRGR